MNVILLLGGIGLMVAGFYLLFWSIFNLYPRKKDVKG